MQGEEEGPLSLRARGSDEHTYTGLQLGGREVAVINSAWGIAESFRKVETSAREGRHMGGLFWRDS